MLVPTLLSTAALAVSVSSFLLPPGSGPAGAEFWAQSPKSTVDVDCPGCGFITGNSDGIHIWADDVETALRLNFTLKEDKILLNDQLFYPVQFPFLSAFYAPLIRKSPSDTLPPQSDPVRLGYALETIPVAHNEEHDILTLQFTVFDLAGRQVHIDTVRIKVSKDTDGRIPLILIDTIPVDAPGSPSAIGMDCKNSLCRMREMIMDKIHQALEKAKAAANAAKNSKPAAWIKGCHNKFRGGRPHHQGGKPDGHEKHPHHQGGKPDGHGQRPHHRPHGHHHHHHGHRLRHFLLRFAHQFVIPIMFGIAAGMAAGAIGMVVGHAIAFMWIKYARGGRRGPYASVSQQEEAVQSDEKDELMAEGPPQYEELEGDAVKVEEKN